MSDRWLLRAQARKLWHELEDVPFDGEWLDAEWNGFPKGTHREEIWHWFEESYPITVTELLYGVDDGTNDALAEGLSGFLRQFGIGDVKGVEFIDASIHPSGMDHMRVRFLGGGSRDVNVEANSRLATARAVLAVLE